MTIARELWPSKFFSSGSVATRWTAHEAKCVGTRAISQHGQKHTGRLIVRFMGEVMDGVMAG